MAKRKTLSVSSILATKRDSIRSIRRDLQRAEASRDSLSAALAMTAALQRAVDSVSADVTVYSNPRLFMYLDTRVDSLKSDRVARILEIAESLGFTETRSSDWVNEWSASRSFHYSGDCFGVGVSIEVRFNLPTDGEACKRVQVGTEIREVPKYEIRCA